MCRATCAARRAGHALAVANATLTPDFDFQDFLAGGVVTGNRHVAVLKVKSLVRPQPGTQVQTTARYAHLASDPIKAAADRISARLGAALYQGDASTTHLKAADKMILVDS